ncbi:hypothetical protein JCM10049v2_007046 [Rhodotorula toruloides]
MLLDLPLDVLPDILRWLDPLQQADFGALENLSKVSRSFREATMPYLLSTVVVYSQQDRRTRGMCQFLLSAGKERGIAAPSNKHIGWQDSDDDMDEDYFDQRPGLRSLVVQGAHFRYVTDVLDDVCRFRNLKTLEVELLDDDWLWRWEDYDKKGLRVQSNLDRLIIGSPTTKELFDQLSGSSRSTVHTLGLSLLRESLDLSDFAQLKNLIVKACQYGVVRETLNTVPAGVTYLEIRESGVIANLERLMRRQELQPHGYPIYDSDEEDEVCSKFEPIFGDAGSTIRTLLAGIPSHIKHLRLPQFYSSEDMQIITSSFASPTYLPQLQVLEIGNPLKDLYTNATEWDADEEEREIALRGRLRDVCAARGVEIGPYDEHWGQVQSEEGTIPRALLLG